MDEKGWDYGEDDEELLEYAMHPTQYEDFKSGKAKKVFLEDLQKRKEGALVDQSQASATPQPVYNLQPKVLNLDVNGEKFKVSVSYDENETITAFLGISLLCGVIAFVFLWIYNISFNSNFRKDKDLIKFITSRSVLLFAMMFSGFHLVFMGVKGWLNPAGWQAGIPPISLIAFTFFAIGFIINLAGRK